MPYKLTTYDFRSPLQGGPPLQWDGSCPFVLPRTTVDESEVECGRGWNACADLADAIRIAGEWPDGRPSRAWYIEPVAGTPVLERGNKLRSASWTIVRPATATEWREARLRLYAPLANPADDLVAEVEAWSAALARPKWDEATVEISIKAALAARGLTWKLHRFSDAWAARATSNAWAASLSWAASDSWAARYAWAPRDVWAAWDARYASDARDALTLVTLARCGRATRDPMTLTVGIRDAYTHGLAVAVPTGPSELGWAMDTKA